MRLYIYLIQLYNNIIRGALILHTAIRQILFCQCFKREFVKLERR